jgi:peptidoglycan/xylan/chitin deacetylase (PgdA/CDA1 family)
MHGRSLRNTWLRYALPVLGLWATATAVKAADCPRPDTLGTSRVMVLDAASTPRVGLKSFPQTLPLADKEVVLTFDDGPNPLTTKRVLTALADECVHATFFVIGQSAKAHPDLLKAMAAAGHTVGHHSWSHPNLARMPTAAAEDNIARGIAADRLALNDNSGAAPATGFFRFPFFASTRTLLDDMQGLGLVVFGADLWASDWNPMQPAQELALITRRLQKARKGIILFHDTKARTATMLPSFLHYLRDNGYHIVHVVPKLEEGTHD